MKMTKNISILIIIIISIFSSCKEKEIIETGTITSQDYITAENIFNDVGRVVEDAFIDNGTSKNCHSYTLMNADTSNQDTIIVDFGDGNPVDCLSYGKLRRGKMIIMYTGKYRDSLSVITTTFDHYYVNNKWIQGKRVATNNGRNQNGNVTFSIEVENASITGNGTINWNSSRTREWISGYNTFANPFDDKYIVSGSASGNSTSGQDFTLNITKDLYVDLGCLISTTNPCVVTSGKAELIPTGFSTRFINYGDSICDCNFTITLNGADYLIVTN